MPPAPPPTEHDRDALVRYLLSFRWSLRDEEAERAVVHGGVRLWQRILDFVPEPATPAARALELGSPPFHITLLLQHFRRYALSLSAFPVGGEGELTRVLESPEHGEHHVLTCRCFDAERDAFPYADATFDLVLWCEVIEHLTANPVHALAEIHRVLKPGGALVVTTPNVARTDNVAALLRGDNVYDPYHLGSPLSGSRHSREYTFAELRDLLTGCGFAIERMEDHDISALQTRSARLLAPFHRLLAAVTRGRHRGHLFVRARKTDAAFRWHFPPGLFDPAHLAMHAAPHAARVVMGENDVPHTGSGFEGVRAGPGGEACRRCHTGDLWLAPGAGAESLTLRLAGGRGEVQVFQDRGAPTMLVWEAFDAPAGAWRDVAFPLADALVGGAPVQVRIVAPDGVLVRAVALASSRPR